LTTKAQLELLLLASVKLKVLS